MAVKNRNSNKPKGIRSVVEYSPEDSAQIIGACLHLYETSKKIAGDFLKSSTSGVNFTDLIIGIHYNQDKKTSALGFSVKSLTIQVDLPFNAKIEGGFVLSTFVELIKNAINVTLSITEYEISNGNGGKELKREFNIIQSGKNITSLSFLNKDSMLPFTETVSAVNENYFKSESNELLTLPIEVLADAVNSTVEGIEAPVKTYEYTQALYLYFCTEGFICLAQTLTRSVRSPVIDFPLPYLVTDSGESGYLVYFLPRSLIPLLTLCKAANLGGEISFAEEETFIKISMGNNVTVIYENNHTEFYARADKFALDILERFEEAELEATNGMIKGTMALVKAEEGFKLQLATLAKATKNSARVTVEVSNSEKSEVKIGNPLTVTIETLPLEAIKIYADYEAEGSNTLADGHSCTFVVLASFLATNDAYFGCFSIEDPNHPLYQMVLFSGSATASKRTKLQLLNLEGSFSVGEETTSSDDYEGNHSTLNDDEDIPF